MPTNKKNADDKSLPDNIEPWFHALMAIGKIHERHSKTGKWRGSINCPACNRRLRWTMAQNNKHIWGACEDKDCLRWMQ